MAIEAGVSEKAALDILRGQDDIDFSRSKSGQLLVGVREAES
jgi:hypothetical protein